MLCQKIRRIVEHQERFRSTVQRLQDCSENGRGLPAFRDGDEQIPLSHPHLPDLPASELRIIFERFHRPHQRIVAAGHNTEHLIGIRFQPLVFRTASPPHALQKNAQTAGRSAAGKDNPSTGTQSPLSTFHQSRIFLRGEDPPRHRKDVPVHALQRFHAVHTRTGKILIQCPRQGTGLLRRQKTKMKLCFVFQKIHRFFQTAVAHREPFSFCCNFIL